MKQTEEIVKITEKEIIEFQPRLEKSKKDNQVLKVNLK